MHHFHYKKNELYCEEVNIKDLAAVVGTPFYLYSYETITRHLDAFTTAFSSFPHLVCYAMKANSNKAILKIVTQKGCGLDIVSGGELFRALQAGAPADKIVYAGVGKTAEEIRNALIAGILMFNVESAEELSVINTVARQVKKKARIALRINPDIDPKTHPYISTGLKSNKFGIPIESAIEEYKIASQMDSIEVVGVHKHIGSQITQIGPFVESLEKILVFTNSLKENGIPIQYLNLGGGLGITYKDETPPHPEEFANAILPLLAKTDYTIIFEPGRVIMGNAGILVSKVLYIKDTEEKRFIIVDAGMNDLARPSLYNSYQDILPLMKQEGTSSRLADIVGPICESGDFLAKDRLLPEFKRDDLLAVMSAGAYGFSMSSNYNSRLRVPEVLVKGESYSVIRERETMEDLIKGEKVPEFL